MPCTDAIRAGQQFRSSGAGRPVEGRLEPEVPVPLPAPHSVRCLRRNEPAAYAYDHPAGDRQRLPTKPARCSSAAPARPAGGTAGPRSANINRDRESPARPDRYHPKGTTMTERAKKSQPIMPSRGMIGRWADTRGSRLNSGSSVHRRSTTPPGMRSVRSGGAFR